MTHKQRLIVRFEDQACNTATECAYEMTDIIGDEMFYEWFHSVWKTLGLSFIKTGDTK